MLGSRYNTHIVSEATESIAQMNWRTDSKVAPNDLQRKKFNFSWKFQPYTMNNPGPQIRVRN